MKNILITITLTILFANANAQTQNYKDKLSKRTYENKIKFNKENQKNWILTYSEMDSIIPKTSKYNIKYKRKSDGKKFLNPLSNRDAKSRRIIW